MDEDEDAMLQAAIRASLGPVDAPAATGEALVEKAGFDMSGSDMSMQPCSSLAEARSIATRELQDKSSDWFVAYCSNRAHIWVKTGADSQHPYNSECVTLFSLKHSQATADPMGPAVTSADTAASDAVEAPGVAEPAAVETVPEAPAQVSTTRQQFDIAAKVTWLEVEAARDRESAPAPVAPEGPLGSSLLEFLQICLARCDVAVKGDLESCVQLRCTRQNNDHSCGYFALYCAKSALDLIQARTEVAAFRAATGLRHEDRALEFVKSVHASLKDSLRVQMRMQNKQDKKLFDNFEMTRADAAEVLDNHPLLKVHREHITLVCDPSKLEPVQSSPMNPSIRDLDVIFDGLRNGSRRYHAFFFGAEDHFFTLVVWSRSETEAQSEERTVEANSDLPAVRHFELLLFDSQNEPNFSLDLEHPPDPKRHLVARVRAARSFVDLVSACTRGGEVMASRRLTEAVEAFFDHTKRLMDADSISISLVRKWLDDHTFVQESIHLLERLFSMAQALDGPIRLNTAADEERLRHVVRSMIQTTAASIEPPTLGRSTSTCRPLPLSRTLSGELWVKRHDQLLRRLASELGLDDLPDTVDWGPSIPPPPDSMVSTVVKVCLEVIDMSEARELLMAIAHQDGRTEVGTQDVETALRLLQEEQQQRPMCINGHPLAKGKRDRSWCNCCNKGFIPPGIDPVTFLALPRDLQKEQREQTKCLIMSDYLCKECEYFCCDQCFMGKGRGTMIQACLRASRGIKDPPDTEWRCYSDYNAFVGEGAVDVWQGETAPKMPFFTEQRDSQDQDAESKDRDAVIELAKARCIECGFGGFVMNSNSVHFRKESSIDCYANLLPADGFTFHVAPRREEIAADTVAQQPAGCFAAAPAATSDANAKTEANPEHLAKIANLQELVVAMGCSTINDRQAVYWLEQGSYVPENAISLLLDSFDLQPPSNWVSSCSGCCCRLDPP